MLDQVLQAVRTLAIGYAAPYTTIDNGSMPTENGLAIYPGPGYSTGRYLDRGADYQVPFVLNGKHSDLGVLLSAMSNIHTKLSMLSAYPKTDGWQITGIESATPPNYLSREDSNTRQWLYGSILTVKFHVKGV